MAAFTSLCFLLVLSLSMVSRHPRLSTASLDVVDKISDALSLSSKGYSAMALTLELNLKALIPPPNQLSHNKASPPITIFVPTDHALCTSTHPKLSLHLLLYHVTPNKLHRQAFETTLPAGSKVDTLLPDHPLHVTTVPESGQASINDVKITDWDIYEDEHVVVHGIDGIFDPGFRTVDHVDGILDLLEGVISDAFDSMAGLMSWVGDEYGKHWAFGTLVLTVAALRFMYFAHSCYGYHLNRRRGGGN